MTVPYAATHGDAPIRSGRVIGRKFAPGQESFASSTHTPTGIAGQASGLPPLLKRSLHVMRQDIDRLQQMFDNIHRKFNSAEVCALTE